MAADASNNEYAAKQLAAAAARLLTPEQYRTEPKVYFHQHNGAKFHVDLGKGNVMTVMFANYKLVTDDKRVQEQLDLVADQQGTFIYTLPQSEAAQILEREREEELRKAVLATAQARAGQLGQQFDPSAPIIPVAMQNPVVPQVMGTYLAENTGMQSSISATQPTEAISGRFTTPADQTKPPTAELSPLEKLNALTKKAQEQQAKPTVDFAAILEKEKAAAAEELAK
jgi:hypothetical protein